MPYTVWGAFDQFRKDVVDLDPKRSERALTSRDYLSSQLTRLASNEPGFPVLYGGYLAYGSFARRTKVRPLDDIDLLLLLNGRGTEAHYQEGYRYWLRIANPAGPLASFPDDFGYVNSTKVLNKIKNSLWKLPNYLKADAKKDMTAVLLDLTSYEWSFDIVPAVPIGNAARETVYYLIPDGRGDWIATDPRIDARNTSRVNQQHAGQILRTIRLLKFWNGRTHKPRLPSYYFEMLALKVFEQMSDFDSFQQALKYFFDRCGVYLALSCPDPKGLGPDLDTGIEYTTKQKVKDALSRAATYAAYARTYENGSDHKTAIYWWSQVFGPQFPIYGS
jgi:hypothetical protein